MSHRAPLVLALTLLPSLALAQSYTRTTRTQTFVSIAGTGTPVMLSDSDDGFAELPAPFPFSFFGQSKPFGTPIVITSNGLIFYGAGDAPYANATIPDPAAPNEFVAPFWDDLIANGGVYSQVDGSMGAQVVTVEWVNAALYGAGGPTGSFSMQVKLHEVDGKIEFHYGAKTGVAGTSGSIGLESAAGASGSAESCTPNCDLNAIAENQVISFAPGGGGPPLGVDLAVHAGNGLPASALWEGSFSIQYTVGNDGAGTAPPTDLSLVIGLGPTPSATDQVLQRETLPPIGAGDTQSGTLNVTLPPRNAMLPPTVTLYARLEVDRDGAVNEANELNNVLEMGSLEIREGGGGDSIVVLTESLPRATVGQFYEALLEQNGGTNVTWARVSGMLPPGLNVDRSGFISGTPTAAGGFAFRVEASQADFTSGFANLLIDVSPGQAGQITITTPEPPSGQVGVFYGFNMGVSGGTAPYFWQATDGSLPPGVSFSDSGAFSGMPTETGTFQINITVFDNNEESATVFVSIVITDGQVMPGALTITVPDQLAFRLNTNATHQLTAEGGTAPYSWRLASELGLPSGLRLSEGFISGVPTSSVSQQVELVVFDQNEDRATKVVMVHVNSDGQVPGGGNNGGGTSSGGGRVGGSSRRVSSGCVCLSTQLADSHATWWLLAGVPLLLLRRRSR